MGFSPSLLSWLEGDWKVQTQRCRLWPTSLSVSPCEVGCFCFLWLSHPCGKEPQRRAKSPSSSACKHSRCLERWRRALSSHRKESSLIHPISKRLPCLPAASWGRFCSLEHPACLGVADLDQKILWSENGFKICLELLRAHLKHLNCRLHIF
jgi:hypothetical protein